jgi:hypothetical protein
MDRSYIFDNVVSTVVVIYNSVVCEDDWIYETLRNLGGSGSGLFYCILLVCRHSSRVAEENNKKTYSISRLVFKPVKNT